MPTATAVCTHELYQGPDQCTQTVQYSIKVNQESGYRVASQLKHERLGRISSGHIIPFGDRQDIILIHCDLSNPTVCKFIVNKIKLL